MVSSKYAIPTTWTFLALLCPNTILHFYKTLIASFVPSIFAPTSNKALQTCWPCLWIRCCTSTYCVHSEHQKIHSNLNSLNTFTKETSSPNVKYKVKLPKVGSNAIVPVPGETGPTKPHITKNIIKQDQYVIWDLKYRWVWHGLTQKLWKSHKTSSSTKEEKGNVLKKKSATCITKQDVK
jgi:hypothetical protein